MLVQRQTFYGESELCRRYGVKLSATVDGKVYEETGIVYLTELSLQFKSFESDKCLFAIDMPLLYIENEEFHQPIFGASFLSGRTRPLSGSGLANKIDWKLIFYEGVGNFIEMFLFYTKNIRIVNDKAVHTINDVKYAFQIPGDDSVLYAYEK